MYFSLHFFFLISAISSVSSRLSFLFTHTRKWFMCILDHWQPHVSSPLYYILFPPLTTKITIFICILFTKQSSACSVVLFPIFFAGLCPPFLSFFLSFAFPLAIHASSFSPCTPPPWNVKKTVEDFVKDCVSFFFFQLFSSWCAACETAFFCDTSINIIFTLIMKLWYFLVKCGTAN